MEQNVINKLNEATDLVRKMIDEYNQTYVNFKEELFTPEMKDIVSNIVTNTHKVISIYFNDEYDLWINEKCSMELKSKKQCDNKIFLCDRIIKSYLTKDQVKYLKNSTLELESKRVLFNELVDKAEDIITEITEIYREINERCMDDLNWIMETLGKPQNDVRHIKITVEWV